MSGPLRGCFEMTASVARSGTSTGPCSVLATVAGWINVTKRELSGRVGNTRRSWSSTRARRRSSTSVSKEAYPLTSPVDADRRQLLLVGADGDVELDRGMVAGKVSFRERVELGEDAPTVVCHAEASRHRHQRVGDLDIAGLVVVDPRMTHIEAFLFDKECDRVVLNFSQIYLPNDMEVVFRHRYSISSAVPSITRSAGRCPVTICARMSVMLSPRSRFASIRATALSAWFTSTRSGSDMAFDIPMSRTVSRNCWFVVLRMTTGAFSRQLTSLSCPAVTWSRCE